MALYGTVDTTSIPRPTEIQTNVVSLAHGAGSTTHNILIHSRYWWGSGGMILECWNCYYDGRSMGYAKFIPRGVTNSAASGMSILTEYNSGCPTPSWGGYGGTSPGRNCILSFSAGSYTNYVWKLTSMNMAYYTSASSVDNNNSVHLYGGTRLWG